MSEFQSISPLGNCIKAFLFSTQKIVPQEFHATSIRICNAPFFCAIESEKKSAPSRLQCFFCTFSSVFTCFVNSVVIEYCDSFS